MSRPNTFMVIIAPIEMDKDETKHDMHHCWERNTE